MLYHLLIILGLALVESIDNKCQLLFQLKSISLKASAIPGIQLYNYLRLFPLQNVSVQLATYATYVYVCSCSYIIIIILLYCNRILSKMNQESLVASNDQVHNKELAAKQSIQLFTNIHLCKITKVMLLGQNSEGQGSILRMIRMMELCECFSYRFLAH